jgi:soluble lytic murein transglycosylase
MPFEDDVMERAAAEPLDPLLAYGVMRQESNFDPDAVSPAHAVGLMQLLPETGRTVAVSLGMPYDDARLVVPGFNIALGMHYLHDLGDKFHGQVPLVVASYNAGEDTIARWVGRAPGMDMDVFVERIPFAETRAYVARVMAHYAHYAYLKRGEAGVPRLVLTVRD